MRLLLDTHIWIWYLLGDERLSVAFQSAIASSANELWLSPISVWEVLVLAEKGKLELNPDAIAWVKKNLRLLDTQEARLTHEIALLSRQLDFKHSDPADRFLAATAVHLDLILVTVDSRLRELTWLPTLV